MAAGQGFKTFTTGEVLTAGDVNGYLMQGINVFATTTARNAAITAPAEGQFAFTKDTNSLWYYDGAAWVASGATGDIEGVTAGVGISGGGTSGTVTITNDMATTITAAGDIVIGTGSGTYDNLPIGTTDQILTADTTVSPYKVKWAAAPGGGLKPMTLLNSGGTALTGSATVTVSGISNQQMLLVLFDGASTTSAGQMGIRINGVTTSNYRQVGIQAEAAVNNQLNALTSRWIFGDTGTAAGTMMGAVMIFGANAAGIMAMSYTGIPGDAGRTGNVSNGYFDAAAAITSISANSGSNFDAGTIYVYGMSS